MLLQHKQDNHKNKKQSINTHLKINWWGALASTKFGYVFSILMLNQAKSHIIAQWLPFYLRFRKLVQVELFAIKEELLFQLSWRE